MQVQMNPLSFLWWRLGKKASKPAAVIPQKPDHNLIRIFASPLSYSNSEPQKSRYDSTSKAGHGEKISRCTSEHRAEKICMLWILAKERRKETVGIQRKRLRMLLSSHFPLILPYEAQSKALEDKNTSIFPQESKLH